MAELVAQRFEGRAITSLTIFSAMVGQAEQGQELGSASVRRLAPTRGVAKERPGRRRRRNGGSPSTGRPTVPREEVGGRRPIIGVAAAQRLCSVTAAKRRPRHNATRRGGSLRSQSKTRRDWARKPRKDPNARTCAMAPADTPIRSRKCVDPGRPRRRQKAGAPDVYHRSCRTKAQGGTGHHISFRPPARAPSRRIRAPGAAAGVFVSSGDGSLEGPPSREPRSPR